MCDAYEQVNENNPTFKNNGKNVKVCQGDFIVCLFPNKYLNGKNFFFAENKNINNDSIDGL